MTIEDYFGEWSKVVDLKEADRIIRKLSASNLTICPSINNIFKAFRLCSFHNLQCIILAKGPYSDFYEGKPRATGLAFANDASIPEKNISPSLETLKESVIDYTKPHGITIFDPSLEKWEKQGVLLLNTALSCEIGKAEAHNPLWKPFIQSLLTNLSGYTVGIIYVLMGSYAQSFEPCINKRCNFIIRCRHPSYYAQTDTRMPSDIWKQINSILIGQRGYGIEWFEEEKYSDNQ